MYLMIRYISRYLPQDTIRIMKLFSCIRHSLNVLILLENRFKTIARGHPRAFREGEVLRQFQDFREKFWSKFWISLYLLYVFTSPSAQDREVCQLRETFSPRLPSRMTPDLRGSFICVTCLCKMSLFVI